MASEGDDSELPAEAEQGAQASHEPRECMPCRGSGQVISNLGGKPALVSCPWCEGGGVRLAGIDAQSRWQTQGERAATPPDSSPDTAA